MCDGLTEVAAITAAVAAVGGSAISYSASQDAAGAARSAQDQAMANQNQAFQSRMATQQAETEAQAQVNQQSAAQFSANQRATQQAQSDALDQRAAATKNINDRIAANSATVDKAVQTATGATTGQALTDAQTNQAVQQQAMNAPAIADTAASNPLGASSSGLVKEAMDKGSAGAAAYVKNYGDTLAKLSAYNAPIALAGQTATTLGTNLMPAGAADALVRGTAPALLAPSTTAYQNAGAYGNAVNQANAAQTQSGTILAQDRAQNAIDLANLNQQDTANFIQGNLNVSQADAAAKAGLGQGITALGNAGLQYAGSQGAFAKAKTPSANAILAAPYTTGGPVTWSIK